MAIKYGGSISVDPNDGIIRTPYLEKQFGSHMVGLFAEIKNIFDPCLNKKISVTCTLYKTSRIDEIAIDSSIRQRRRSRPLSSRKFLKPSLQTDDSWQAISGFPFKFFAPMNCLDLSHVHASGQRQHRALEATVILIVHDSQAG